jgi:hypothetical protein
MDLGLLECRRDKDTGEGWMRGRYVERVRPRRRRRSRGMGRCGDAECIDDRHFDR